MKGQRHNTPPEMFARLEAALVYAGIDQSELSAKLGHADGFVNKWLRGTMRLNHKDFIRVCWILNVSPTYIMFGSGPRRLDDASGSPGQRPALPPDLKVVASVVGDTFEPGQDDLRDPGEYQEGNGDEGPDSDQEQL